MALSLEAEQRLAKVELIEFFTARKVQWAAAAKTAYKYVKDTFPGGATIRRDDVAGVLRPVIAVDIELRKFLDEAKLTQKYWVTYFTDLIVDRTWDQISN